MSDTIPPVYRSAIDREWRPNAVYAIRYATRPTALRKEHFYGHDECGDDSMPIDYYVWLVTGPGAAISPALSGSYRVKRPSPRLGRRVVGRHGGIARWPSGCWSSIVCTSANCSTQTSHGT